MDRARRRCAYGCVRDGGDAVPPAVGRPPFEGHTRDDLAAKHCNEPPPRLSTLNPTVSEGLVRVVERALDKRPEDRYIDAGAMLRDLEALLLGEATGIPMHPILPAYDPRKALRFEFRWELEASPRQLWPFVTNTDRLDRAIGFPAMKYTTRYEPGRGVRTFAEGRKAGMIEVGEEHPYEWVEPRRMGVLREYSQGPFVWLVSVVELIPRPGGGTILVHRLDLEPSNWKIRLGSRWGVGVGLRKSLESVYRRIDATVKGPGRRGAALDSDPFEEPARLPPPGNSASIACWIGWPSGASTRRSSSDWASTWRTARRRKSPGSGRWPWPIGSASIATRSSPPASTAPARACSSSTGTCSARSAGSRARSRTRSARSPSTPTARPAISTSSWISPTRSS